MEKTLHIPKILLIGGSEPLGCAGIQADLKAVCACGGYGAAALSCIVDEDTHRVKSIHPLPAQLIVEQCISCLQSMDVDCIKTGLLYSAETVRTIGEILHRFNNIPLIIDPVFVGYAKTLLITPDVIEAYQKYLFPLAALITPNATECEILLQRSLKTDNVQSELKELCQWGNYSIIMKSVFMEGKVCDYFYESKTDSLKAYSKVPIRKKDEGIRDAGDSFASSIATYLGKQYPLSDAIWRAEFFIDNSIQFGHKIDFSSKFNVVHSFGSDDFKKIN